MASTANASAETATSWYVRRQAVRNRCNLGPLALAAQAFQDAPQPIEIAWVRQEHHGLLTLCDRLADPLERADLFLHYMTARFAADRRAGYLAVLRGWGVDSNGASGAVLKGWAEDRFGLRAIWHRTVLSDHDAQERFAAERQRGALSGVGQQLDLLYTFCQDELRRRHPGRRCLTLWRGSHDAECYEVKIPDARGQIVEFNNVSSFSGDREVAWEFGSRVWEVEVPLAKIVCFNGLLPGGLLQGEHECIVLGGDYRVRALVA